MNNEKLTTEEIENRRKKYLFDYVSGRITRKTFHCQLCATEFQVLGECKMCPACGSEDFVSIKEGGSDGEAYAHTTLEISIIFKPAMLCLKHLNLTPLETIWTEQHITDPDRTFTDDVWIIPTTTTGLIGLRTNPWHSHDKVIKVFRIKDNDPALWQEDSDEITEPYFDPSENWTQKEIAKGIVRYTSPANPVGYFHLSKNRNKKITKSLFRLSESEVVPEKRTLREPSGWYHDGQFWIILSKFPDLFTEADITEDVIKNLQPHAEELGELLTEISIAQTPPPRELQP